MSASAGRPRLPSVARVARAGDAGRRWTLRIVAVAVLVALYLLFERWQYWNLGQRYAHLSVTGSWPSGWISYLVSGLAVVGIFSLLMVHPDRMDAKHGWIDRYARAFWIAIVPSAAMVLMALWQRVDQYGVTERRYLLGVLAALGVATFVGPWS